MLEITIDNCYKCDLETINDPNNSQYFWINRRDLEIESKRNWQAISDKCKDSSRQKYRKELTPNTDLSFYDNRSIAIAIDHLKCCHGDPVVDRANANRGAI